MYKRPQYQILMNRLNEPRMFIQVLAGPRQVGKSTLVSQVLENIAFPYDFYSADDTAAASAQWIRSVWDMARAGMSVQGGRERLLVIDEIQKIDNWSETVKAEWDRDTREKRCLKVVILGSSRLLLKKGLTESLAGRFEMIRMGHWSYKEMHEAFGWELDRYIYYGGYPGTAGLVEDPVRWHTYVRDSLVESSISKDVLMTSTIYKPALLRQLFEIGCAYSSKELSLTKILGQLQDSGNVTTLQNYLRVLDECNMLTGLQKYAGDTARRYNSIPKFQVYNNALSSAYDTEGMDACRLDMKKWGRSVESCVGAHLLNNSDQGNYKVYYWREANDEVDFVIEQGRKVIAIEVKSGRRSSNKGLPAFSRHFNPYRSIVVGTGGISFENFLSADPACLFM